MKIKIIFESNFNEIEMNNLELLKQEIYDFLPGDTQNVRVIRNSLWNRFLLFLLKDF